MARKIPHISERWLYDPREPHAPIQLDTAAWFAWLEQATTISFSYPIFDPHHGYIVGFMTARKERRQRGYVYWSAYRRIHGRLHKHYLGPSPSVTAARLATIAERYRAAGATERTGAETILQAEWTQQQEAVGESGAAVVSNRGEAVQWEEVTALPDPGDETMNEPPLDVTSKEPRTMDTTGSTA